MYITVSSVYVSVRNLYRTVDSLFIIDVYRVVFGETRVFYVYLYPRGTRDCLYAAVKLGRYIIRVLVNILLLLLFLSLIHV